MSRELDDLTRKQADYHFVQHQQAIYRRTDRLFACLMMLQWVAAVVAAVWISPLTWAGRESQIHFHVWTAIFLGGAVTIFPVALGLLRPGEALTRYVISVGQMLMSALLIHLSGGRIETHFHVFGSLAFLAFYRDWKVFVPATIVVAADHFLRGVYWPESVYGVLTAGSWRWVEHSAWVMFEDTFLLISCHQSVQEMRDMAWQRAELEVANAKTEETVITRTAELQASEAELGAARDRALEATRLKSEFLANMSHEIRTPMNAIIGMTDIVLDSELTPEQQEYLDTVKLSSRALLTLLNDVLDLSKIESGRLTIDTVPFSLRDGVGDMLRTLAVRAHHQGLELACDIGADVPDAMVGDPARLRQIIINLVGNAIKFTEEGEVVIRVQVAQRNEHEALLHFSVADTGIGIDAQKQSLIFVPFVQADGSMTRQYGGTGLGLTIASQLVEMMGGRIWLESEVGQGSTFHFTARLGIGAETATRPARTDASQLNGVRALVVDDSSTTREILVAMLRGWGIAPVGVGNGDAALVALSQPTEPPFDLVVIDAHMPGLDGITLARLIRENSRLAEIPVILLTSSGLHGQRVGELRRVFCLTKPVIRSHFLEAIQTMRSGADPEHTTPSRRAIDRSDRSLRVLVAEDNAVNRKVAVGLLRKRGHRVVAVTNGKEAVATVEREPFDVIVMDVQMPGMNGYEATTAIRAREKETGNRVAIVALTAHAMTGDREHCLEVGMDAYVAKPVEADELFETIEHLVSGTPRHAPKASIETIATEVLDRQAVYKRVRDDQELLLDIVATFQEESAALTSELREAIASGDGPAVVRAAHSLKGALKTLAAGAAAAAALRLEQHARNGDFGAVVEEWAVFEAEMTRLNGAIPTLCEELDARHERRSATG